MERQVVTVKDVMECLACKKTRAYTIIRQLNRELTEKNIITTSGRVPRKYFYERMGIR